MPFTISVDPLVNDTLNAYVPAAAGVAVKVKIEPTEVDAGSVS